MTLYDLIMSQSLDGFTREDWSRLGRGLITDEDTIRQMVMEGYGAMVVNSED